MDQVENGLATVEHSNETMMMTIYLRKVRTRPRTRGFTLVESTVCAAITAMLAAVVLPAVQAAREAARTTNCKNNLKQIGLALHNYHSTYAGFPPGWNTMNRESAYVSGNSWMMGLTPYVDQGTVYNTAIPDCTALEDLPENRRTAYKIRLRIYRCPADSTPNFNPFRGKWPTSNYAGNAGHLPFPRWVRSPNAAAWPGQMAALFPDPSDKQAPKMTGVFGSNSFVKINDFTDGTSNTISVGERSILTGAGIWPGVTAGGNETDLTANCSHGSRPGHSFGAFSSQHPSGGVNILMGDGRVVSMSPNINSERSSNTLVPSGLLQKLSHRNDGQPVEF